MKILLSAFACEAGRGSEPGLGWNWACNLARAGHEVWVLTRGMYREANESAPHVSQRLHFVYYDQPRVAKIQERARLNYYLYYRSWQYGAYRVAQALHRSIRFDLVQHITFATARVGSCMGKLGIPFVFGPVAGGETIPWRLRKSLPLESKIHELVRDLSNLSIGLSPGTRKTLRAADLILVTNAQTAALVPQRYRHKCRIQLAIGIEPSVDARPRARQRTGELFRALYVGQLEYRKGIHLALQAFARARAKHPAAEFTIVGNGPQARWLREIAADLALKDCVRWVEWMPRDQVLDVYSSHDVFLFPSIRDSGGMVVLEALANGVPVVCVDLGGPGVIVNDSCGRVVPAKGSSENEVVGRLADELLSLAKDPELRRRLSEGALRRAQQFSWANVVNQAYSHLGLTEDLAICPQATTEMTEPS